MGKPSAEGNEIRYLLRHLKAPAKWNQSQWLASCLVTGKLREQPKLSAAQAVRAVFRDILLLLEAENPDHADILRGRFWDSLTVASMVGQARPQVWSERNFFIQQDAAIERFNTLLQERERACDQQQVQQSADLSKGEHRPLVIKAESATSALKTDAEDSAWVTLGLERGERDISSAPIAPQVQAPQLEPASDSALAAPNQTNPSPAESELPPLRSAGMPAVTSRAAGKALSPPAMETIANPLPNVGSPSTNWSFRHLPAGVRIGGLLVVGGILFQIMYSQLLPSGRTAPTVQPTASSGTPQLYVPTQVTLFPGTGTTPSVVAATTLSTATISRSDPGVPSTFIPSSPAPATTQEVYVCGEAHRLPATTNGTFLRDQGVSVFTVENTDGAVLSSKARALAMDGQGLWTGYFTTTQSLGNGLGQYNKRSWASCTANGGPVGQNVNALLVDQLGHLWVGAEKGGVFRWDGTHWLHYTTTDGLPTNELFGLAMDAHHNILAATLEGIASFDGTSWTVPYTTQTTLFNNRVHALAFTADESMWVGHIGNGITYYRSRDNNWLAYTKNNSGLGGDKVRSIAVQPAHDGTPETIWIATADGGVSRFLNNTWTVYRLGSGLPSDDAQAVAIDHYNRVWVATSNGVVYWDGKQWIIYDTLSTLSLAFGLSNCPSCIYDDDHIWTGTATDGLTHSRLPYPDEAFDVLDVRYPKIVAPGQMFRPEIVVAPRAGHELRESWGDYLSNIDPGVKPQFGAYEHIAVKGTIAAGVLYTFSDYDNLLQAPQLPPGKTEETYTSSWRIWNHTRYAGPVITITFTVRQGFPTLTP